MTEKQSRDGSTRVLELFEEGRKFTQDVLKENERLRGKLALVEDEVRSLRADNEELRAQFSSVEEENREFADRYVQVERQNSDLINLYVASHRLHSTLEYGEVVDIIKEIVVNMIGSETFGVYAVDEKQRRLVLIGHEGLDGKAAEVVGLEDGVLGKCAREGETYVAPAGTAVHEQRPEPIACIALKVGDRVLGVIGIYRLLLQKPAFNAGDLDLFELLSGHAATAVFVSKLYSISKRDSGTLSGVTDLLR